MCGDCSAKNEWIITVPAFERGNTYAGRSVLTFAAERWGLMMIGRVGVRQWPAEGE